MDFFMGAKQEREGGGEHPKLKNWEVIMSAAFLGSHNTGMFGSLNGHYLSARYCLNFHKNFVYFLTNFSYFLEKKTCGSIVDG